jgi:hypothetical protein
MEILFKISGILLMGLSLVHVIFPRYFNWKQELASLRLINRQMMYVHTLFVALVVFLMGLLCFFCAEELVSTTLGKNVSLGLAIFWGLRLLVQFFGYSSALWRGKSLETAIHIFFSLLWIYLTLIYFANCLS